MSKKLNKMINTSRLVKVQYGRKGLAKSIVNKLCGRDLLYGIDNQNNKNIQTMFFNNALSVWNNQQNELTKQEQENKILSFDKKPLISIIMPIYNAPVKWLDLAVESLKKQSYTNWELIAVDDGSKDKRGISILKKEAEKDSRIRPFEAEKNGGISKTSNIAISHAKGEYIALMDQDDEISLDALFWMVDAINKNPDGDLFYSDECKIKDEVKITPCDFIIKPDWSIEMLYNHMYTGHFSIYKKDLVEKLGGFRSEYDFSQDYDLALRVSDVTNKIIHVERILYYWRMIPTSGAAGGKDFARISNLKALGDSFRRKGIIGKPEMAPYANRYHVILKENPLVSIVIPSDSTKMLNNCISKLIGSETSYQNIEIIVVANSKTCEEIKGIFEYCDCVKVCNYDKTYNFSDKCNQGAKMAKGEYVVIYNDDVYPTSSNWIEGLLEIMQYPGVGGVSPMTVYENKTIQYAGMITGVANQVGTSFNGLDENLVETPTMNHFLLRDVSVLCGACMMMRTDFYHKIGGFDAVNTPTGHSDVDISFRIREEGLRCVYTPLVKLVHIGNHSWENKKFVDKSQIYCLKKWGKYLANDPYFTKTMRKVFYRDIEFNYQLYVPDKKCDLNKGKDILLITHELTRSGAPIVLKNVVRYFLEKGDYPVVVSPLDGPLRQEFLDMGIPVIIDESVINGHWTFEHFARNFDLVIANTIAVSTAVSKLSNSLPPVIWWIHEGKIAFEMFKNILPQSVGSNISVYAVSPYTQNVMNKYGLNSNGILFYGFSENKNISVNYCDNNCNFLVVGKIESRKGQDIAIEAFKMLPEEVQNDSKLLIIGAEGEQSINECVHEACKNKNIEYLGLLPNNEVLKKYEQCCALLVPSRDDPMPMTATEAMSLSIPCIVSNKTGIASLIKDNVNGFVFNIDNPNELSKKMLYLYENKNTAKEIGKYGRKIYDENFTYEKFAINLDKIVCDVVNKYKK